MGDDRRNYVMSVELAMKREMAYREKLESLSTTEGGGGSSSSSTTSSTKSPLLSQVTLPTPTSSQPPRMIPGPSPTPCPRPTLAVSPNPRPHPYLGPRPGQVPPFRPKTWNRGPNPGPMPLVRSHFSGPHPRPSPTSGSMPLVRPHFPGPRPSPSPTSGHPTHSADHKRKFPLQVVNHHFFCELCQVDCTSPINLKMHFKGQKHKAKLKEAKGKQIIVADGAKAKGKAQYCELCGIWCTDEFSLRLHLNGKNHILKLHASQKMLKGPDGGCVVPQI